MAICRKLPVMPLTAAAFAVSATLAIAQVAGQPESAAPVAKPAASSAARTAIDTAERFLAEGRAVAARETIVRAFQNADAISATDPLRREAMEVLGRAGDQLKRMDAGELSLQKAEFALHDGDIRMAERHVQAVLKSATNDESQAASAHKLMARVDARRGELSAIVPDALAQAERDFLAGRYEEAKRGLELVDRSGVRLTAAQQSSLDGYQLKILQLADTTPGLFGHTATLGVMQPGVVRRQGNDQPETPPPAEPSQPPAADPEPVDLPPAPAAEPSQPTGDELIRQARITEARSLLAQADQDFDNRNLVLARSRYETILAQYRDVLTPGEIQHINDRLAQAGIRAGSGQPPTPEQELIDRQVAKQQTMAKFDNFMNLAQAALESGDTNEARNNAAAARLEITSGRGLFAEPEFETYQQRVANMLATIDETEAALDAARRADQEEQLRITTRERDEQQRAERERRIVELIDRARAYQAEKRYEEALQAVEQLLFIDNLNPTGLLLRELYTDIIIYIKSNEIYDRKHVRFALQELDNQDASVPPAGIIDFPTDWPALSIRRGEPLAFAETPENRAVLAELNTKRIPSVAFSDNALGDVVQFVQTITNLNVDVDWSSLELIGIQRDTPVTLNLTNVSAKTLLDRIVEKISGLDRLSRADWAVTDGVIALASKEKIDRNTILVIYDVRDLLVEIPDYREVPRIDLQQALQASQQGGGGGQSPFREEGGGQDIQQQLRDRDERMDDLINLITSNVDFDSWVENGGDVGKIQKLTSQGSLIITNTAKNHRLVGGLLSKLREIRAMQINVETRFLLVNQDWFEQIGFDIDVIFNANNSQVRALRAGDPTIRASDFFDDGRLSRTVTGPVASGGPVTGDPANTQVTQATPAFKGWSPIGLNNNSLALTTGIAPQTDWSQAILGAAPALGIAGQFLDDIQVDFLIAATQADRRSIQLTAPRLTFTNGQAASIYVATQTAFISDLEPVVGDSAVGFDPTVTTVTEGVTMVVEGTVTADRRYVTMNVDAGVSRVDGFAQQAVTAVAGGQLVNSEDAQSFIQLPQVTVTRVRTTVTVPDQGTLLMGGQRLVTEFEVESGVPVLSKIPILNRFFTNRLESKEEQTLLILVKPTILIQNEEEERHFPGLLDSIRTGLGN